MKNKLKVLTLFFLVIITQSCSVDKPESYFGKTTLNVNKYIDFGSVDFQRMIEMQSKNGLYANIDGKFITSSDNFETHVKTYMIPNIETDIENVKKLKPTEDTKELIEASLKVYNFVKSKYETDYIKIAKLLDQKADVAVIEGAIKELEEQNLDELAKKIDALHKIALPYAKANGIEVSFF